MGNLRPFLPGQSGNPGGRPKTKHFRKALLKLLTENDEPNAKLLEISEAQIALAMRSTPAFEALRDTLDGKPGPNEEATEPLVVIVNDIGKEK